MSGIKSNEDQFRALADNTNDEPSCRYLIKSISPRRERENIFLNTVR